MVQLIERKTLLKMDFALIQKYSKSTFTDSASALNLDEFL